VEEVKHQEYRVETKVGSDGSVTGRGVPFEAGDRVEVIIRSQKGGNGENDRYRLRGKPIRYTNPFGPVAEGDWETMR
jgi:hypothetical protein